MALAGRVDWVFFFVLYSVQQNSFPHGAIRLAIGPLEREVYSLESTTMNTNPPSPYNLICASPKVVVEYKLCASRRRQPLTHSRLRRSFTPPSFCSI